jgi:hypothetical protein
MSAPAMRWLACAALEIASDQALSALGNARNSSAQPPDRPRAVIGLRQRGFADLP